MIWKAKHPVDTARLAIVSKELVRLTERLAARLVSV